MSTVHFSESATALLAFDRDGNAVAFPAGKVRERDADRAFIERWMQSYAAQLGVDVQIGRIRAGDSI